MFGIFGAACKGLHCAGCGKGIPAGIVLFILAVFTGVSREAHQLLGVFANDVAGFLLAMSIAIPVAIIVTGAIASYIGARASGLHVVRWNGPTYSQQWEEANGQLLEQPKYGLPQWPNQPAIENNVQWLYRDVTGQQMPVSIPLEGGNDARWD